MEGKEEKGGGMKNKVLSLSDTQNKGAKNIGYHFDTFFVEFLMQ
jgi:hypothetical protein